MAGDAGTRCGGGNATLAPDDWPCRTAPRATEPYLEVDPTFFENGEYASYAKRYQVLCERLMLERNYNATCLVLATRETPTRVTSPPEALGFAAGIEAQARLVAATI